MGLYANPIIGFRVLVCVMSILCWIQPAHAEFVFGFTNLNNDPEQRANEMGQMCGRFDTGGLNCEMDTDGTPDGESATPTDWVQEIVTIDGQEYWHNVVGDPADGFAIEYFTKFGTNNPDFALADQKFLAETNTNSTIVGDGAAFIPSENLDTGFNRTTRDCFGLMGIGCNPLGHNKYLQANGYQNPMQSAMKMVLSDGETSMVFEKAGIAEKPVITQVVSTADILMEFKADMSNGTYSANGTTLTTSSNFSAIDVFVNKLTLLDPSPDAATGNFDYATDVQAGKTILNAGQFTFTPGLGWSNARPNITFRDVVPGMTALGLGAGRIYDKGTYDYAGGSFNLDGIDWSDYMDSSQNPCGGTPWCDGGGFVVPMP